MGKLLDLDARQIMTSPVVTVPRSASLGAAAKQLVERHLSGAPVVDEEGRAVGVIALRDIATHAEKLLWGGPSERPKTARVSLIAPPGAGPEQAEDPPVRDVMTPYVRTVSVHSSFRDILQMLAQGAYHRVFVVDGTGRPVGVISTKDIVRVVAGAREIFG